MNDKCCKFRKGDLWSDDEACDWGKFKSSPSTLPAAVNHAVPLKTWWRSTINMLQTNTQTFCTKMFSPVTPKASLGKVWKQLLGNSGQIFSWPFRLGEKKQQNIPLDMTLDTNINVTTQHNTTQHNTTQHNTTPMVCYGHQQNPSVSQIFRGDLLFKSLRVWRNPWHGQVVTAQVSQRVPCPQRQAFGRGTVPRLS